MNQKTMLLRALVIIMLFALLFNLEEITLVFSFLRLNSEEIRDKQQSWRQPGEKDCTNGGARQAFVKNRCHRTGGVESVATEKNDPCSRKHVSAKGLPRLLTKVTNSEPQSKSHTRWPYLLVQARQRLAFWNHSHSSITVSLSQLKKKAFL